CARDRRGRARPGVRAAARGRGAHERGGPRELAAARSAGAAFGRSTSARRRPSARRPQSSRVRQGAARGLDSRRHRRQRAAGKRPYRPRAVSQAGSVGVSGDARINTSVREVRRRTAAWADDLDDEGLAELDARMLWSALCEPGDGIAGALVTAFGASRALEIAQGSEHDVSQAGVAPPDLRDARSRWLPRLGDAVHASDSAERAGVRPIVPTGPHWPARVDALGAHAPICLWVKGDPRTLSVPA